MTADEVVFHPDAAEEFRAACEWYAERSIRVAEAFKAEVERAVRLIAEYPDRFPRYGRRHRRFLVRRFPYSVVYTRVADRLWVVAVAHGHRRPGYWRGREAAG